MLVCYFFNIILVSYCFCPLTYICSVETIDCNDEEELIGFSMIDFKLSILIGFVESIFGLLKNYTIYER
jgi:hypothetical protein